MVVSPDAHKEPELLETIGLDAIAFLRFLRLLRWLFLAIAGLCCTVLIPIDFSYNTQHVPESNRNVLSSLTIANVQGQGRVFMHVAMSYIITLLVLGFVWRHCGELLRLRRRWFRSEEYNNTLYARTLMITRIPRQFQNDAALNHLLQLMQIPYPMTTVHIGRSFGRLPELIDYHNETVRSLETVLVRHMKGGKVAEKRPTVTIGGFFGSGGQQKDAIEYYTAKQTKAEATIEECRKKFGLNKAENYGFASMDSVPNAHIVPGMLAGKAPKGTIITVAPSPKDIIWPNLAKTRAVLIRNGVIAFFTLALVCGFNTLPLLVVQSLAKLAVGSQYVPFFKNMSNLSPTSLSLISGDISELGVKRSILAPVAAALLGSIFPIIIRTVSKYQGAPTRSYLNHAVVTRYFSFLIISHLFIFSFIGIRISAAARVAGSVEHAGVNDYLAELKKHPGAIPLTFVQESNFWLTYLCLRGCLAVFDLAQPVNVVWMSIKIRLFGRTPRDIREWTQPPSFGFAVHFSNMLFMAAVSLIYAPLAPLVPLCAAVVFWVSSVAYKHHLTFVSTTKVESGGLLWIPVMNCLMASLILMHVVMMLTNGLQMGWGTFYWISALPPIVGVVVFQYFFLRKFINQFRWWIPNHKEIAASNFHPERADSKGSPLASRFGHPALHSELFIPMLPASMMPLLAQVYGGRLITGTRATVEDLGEKIETQVGTGGVPTAGIRDVGQTVYRVSGASD
ncbi:hypothetical protein FRC01_005537 [Tulasnella sp. 417]|nr:hypothetical protein FRC01_005537 [Tulasnella sp. 417]